MAFPSTNITLKQVCDAYGVPSNMGALRGKYFYTASNPPSALQQVPLTGPISLSLFVGKTAYTGPQTNGPIAVTSSGNITYPPNAPLPISFSLTLRGGGGGGGGGGQGGYHSSAVGGRGGFGGSGALIDITNSSYNTSLPINITAIGNGGSPGAPNAPGTSGGDTVITYNNVTYTAGGGGGGGLGGAGSDVPGAAGTGGNPGNATPSGTNGGANNGGGGGFGGNPNNSGIPGFSGGSGSISITWTYY
jgi:hypothetical protein